MLKVTLDTNVLISATFWEGESYKIIQLIEQKKIKCSLSKEILTEYNKVLHSKEITEKVEEHHLEIKTTIIKLVGICEIVAPTRKIYAVREDPDDNKILECAAEARVDYIVTYDEKHLLKIGYFEGTKIVSPTEFLKLVQK